MVEMNEIREDYGDEFVNHITEKFLQDFSGEMLNDIRKNIEIVLTCSPRLVRH